MNKTVTLATLSTQAMPFFDSRSHECVREATHYTMNNAHFSPIKIKMIMWWIAAGANKPQMVNCSIDYVGP